MRIVVLTDKADRHFYFCNQIIERTGSVVGVITGGKRIRKSQFEKIRYHLARRQVGYWVKNMLLNVAFRKYGQLMLLEKRAVEAEFFGESARHFRENHHEVLISEVLPKHRSINDDHYVALIRGRAPDVIVVMGTCIIGTKILSSAKCVLNIHTGLSPYYRGGYTNLFPFLDDGNGFFGVTVHVMSTGIDAGDIVFTQRPEITRQDNYATINSKSIVLGTDLMVRALRLVEKGKLRAVKQWTNGKLFFNRDMNNYVAYRYFKRRDECLARYVELEQLGRLQKVRLVDEGVEQPG